MLPKARLARRAVPANLRRAEAAVGADGNNAGAGETRTLYLLAAKVCAQFQQMSLQCSDSAASDCMRTMIMTASGHTGSRPFCGARRWVELHRTKSG